MLKSPINENFFHLSTEYTKIRSAGENNDSFPIISNPGLFPFFKLQIALLSSEADMHKLDTFQSNNQKEYWNLVNSLRESKRDNPEKSIDDKIWLTYFSELSTVPPKFDKKIEELNKKVKELEQQPEFKSFSCLGFHCCTHV
jgi:hypothetical protein